TADIVNAGIERKARICAVGTTAMRALESSVSTSNTLNPYEGWTNEFLFPPHEFSIANAMITNFHTPKLTLMMMASAFAGHDFIQRAYKEAIKEKIPFFKLLRCDAYYLNVIIKIKYVKPQMQKSV